MQIVRTILWVLLAVILVLFAVNNWQPVEVRVWSTLVWEPPLAALPVIAFLAGLVPMWLIHRASKWRLRRRIANLETTLGARALPAETAPETAASPISPVSQA
jgi:uncharacterized integral membrane protein